MSDWIAGHEDDASAMNSAIQTNKSDIATLQTDKVDKETGKSLLADTDKANYDDAVSKAHTHDNKSVLDEITSNKVTAWDNKSDFSGNYLDLNNKPTIPKGDGTTITMDEDGTIHGVKVTVDDALSEKSTNPLQNKVIAGELKNIKSKVSTGESIIESNIKRIEANETAISTLNGTGDGSVKKAVSDGIAKVVASAPEDFDTLKEMSDWIAGHEDDASAMNSAISDNKTAIASLQSGKADKSDIPTELPANGGNASTVNGHTVNSDVPENAKFTDTVYDDTDIKKEISEASTVVTTSESHITDTLEAPMLVTKATRNLLKPTLETITKNGVTCTNNGDGTYTLNGTATDGVFFDLIPWSKIAVGNYRVVGCPIGGSDNGYHIQINAPKEDDVNTFYNDIGNGVTFEVYDIVKDNIVIRIKVVGRTTVSNIVFKPMLTTDLSATYDDFVPYDGYEIKTCGKNLFKNYDHYGVYKVATETYNGNSVIYSSEDWSGAYQSDLILKKGKTYAISAYVKGSGRYFIYCNPINESGQNVGIEVEKDLNSEWTKITKVYTPNFDIHKVRLEVRSGSLYISCFQIEEGTQATDYEPYQDGGTVHITPSTEFPLLGLKSFDGETNIISPGNVEVAYAKNDSGKAILDVMESNETLISNTINHNIPRVVPKDITSYMSDGSFYKRLNGTDGYKLFEDIFVGDYIKMSRAISAPNQDSSVEITGSQYVTIIGLDTLMGNGDGDSFVNYHHAVMAPGQGFGGTQHFGRHKMNSTNTTEGGYVASEMNTAVIGAVATSGSTTDTATINQQLYAEFGSHLATTRELVTNSINATGTNRFGDASGCSNNWEWASMQAILMSEIEVYGSIAFSSSGYDTGNAKMQMPLFAHNRQAMNNISAWYWLKDIASATDFCDCSRNGGAYYDSAGNVRVYVRPRFVIKA